MVREDLDFAEPVGTVARCTPLGADYHWRAIREEMVIAQQNMFPLARKTVFFENALIAINTSLTDDHFKIQYPAGTRIGDASTNEAYNVRPWYRGSSNG
jgi:hypothetical protein